MSGQITAAQFGSFAEAYRRVLALVLVHGASAAPRGQHTREVLHAAFTIANPRARCLNARAHSTSYGIAETLWYLLGNNDTAWISHYASLWKSIATPEGTATSAYGVKWRAQLPRVLSELRGQASSRRAVVNILNNTDYANPLDVPCTIALQYLVRDGALHAQTYMRSCDVVWGLPYDVFAFTVLQEILATELGLQLGHYTHTVTSLHLYDRHAVRATKALDDVGDNPQPPPMAPLSLPVPLTLLAAAEQTLRHHPNPFAANVAPVPPPWHDWVLVLAARACMALARPVEEADELWWKISCPGLRAAHRK
jgi:thymidylate synthase